jgi:hypothetical protein
MGYSPMDDLDHPLDSPFWNASTSTSRVILTMGTPTAFTTTDLMVHNIPWTPSDRSTTLVDFRVPTPQASYPAPMEGQDLTIPPDRWSRSDLTPCSDRGPRFNHRAKSMATILRSELGFSTGLTVELRLSHFHASLSLSPLQVLLSLKDAHACPRHSMAFPGSLYITPFPKTYWFQAFQHHDVQVYTPDIYIYIYIYIYILYEKDTVVHTIGRVSLYLSYFRDSSYLPARTTV